MPNIKPVSDLRNYNEVLLEVKKNSPVYLTKNGRGMYAVITIDDHEKMQAEIKLFSELKKGIESAEKDGFLYSKCDFINKLFDIEQDNKKN